MLLSILAVSSSKSMDRFRLPRNTVAAVVVVVGVLIFRRRSCNDFSSVIYTSKTVECNFIISNNSNQGDQCFEEYSLP